MVSSDGTGWQVPPAPADAEVLRNLMQAYAWATDEGRAEALRDMFTADAVWDGRELGYGMAHGPAAIAEAILSHHDPARPMFHFAGPPLLRSVSDHEVVARSWCVAGRGTPSAVIYFEYDDVLRRDGGGRWSFARRRLVLRRRG